MVTSSGIRLGNSPAGQCVLLGDTPEFRKAICRGLSENYKTGLPTGSITAG